MLATALLIPYFLTEELNLARLRDLTYLAPPPLRERVIEVTPYRMPEPKAERIVTPPKPIPEPERLVQPRIVPEPPEVRVPPVEPKPPVETARNTTPPPPPAPRPAVKTGAFSSGSSATPTVNLPAREVQTGGFGDPIGVRGEARKDKVANVAAVGSFDLPAGSGAGNGTGGSKGTRGVVASAGFGNGTATDNPGSGGSGGGTVRQGGFGDATAAAAPAERRRTATGPVDTPVEITFKPRPDYTEEGRRRKIEGEVRLRVQFTATGEVRVLETLSGLGYGLNESAVRAARQIRFKPAQRDGRPVDSTAVVQIVFQLAY